MVKKKLGQWEKGLVEKEQEGTFWKDGNVLYQYCLTRWPPTTHELFKFKLLKLTKMENLVLRSQWLHLITHGWCLLCLDSTDRSHH